MRIIFILFVFVSCGVSAQKNAFSILGSIVGSENFKYVYVFDNNYKLIVRKDIDNGKFDIKGDYSLHQRFGEIPFAKILLNNDELDSEIVASKQLLSSKNPFQCTVILGEPVKLTYYSDARYFVLTGGVLNELQSKFEYLESSFRNSLDSAYEEIGGSNVDMKVKIKMKSSAFRQLNDIETNQVIKIINENPSSVVSLTNMTSVVYNQSVSGNTALSIYNRLSDSLRQSEYGKHLLLDINDKFKREKLGATPSYVIGMKFPEIEFLDLKNEIIKKSSTYGKYTLIDFWATWCVPCRKETPNLILAYNKYRKSGFNLITISLDEQKKYNEWVKVIETDHMDGFINLFNDDGKGRLAAKLKIFALPTNYLLDEEGKIIAMNLRGVDLQKKLDELFNLKN